MKYAYINKSAEGGYEVRIGRDIPGLVSWGTPVGCTYCASFADAVDVCLQRGVPTARIYWE